MVLKTAFSSRIKINYVETLKGLSESTRIPQSKLLEEALEDLFKKHGKEVKNKT